MTSAEMPTPVGSFEWFRVILRLPLAAEVRALASVLRHFAEADGTRVIASVELLAVIIRLSERQTIRLRNVLRDLGLVTLARRGNRRSGDPDEYWLTFPGNILELLSRDGALDPDWRPVRSD